MYEYTAKVLRVVDGDTLDLDVDLGFRVHLTDRYRLAGIDAPESVGPRASDAGRAAKVWLERELPTGTLVRVRTDRDKAEKFGRWLATVFRLDAAGHPDAHSINDAMVAAGHARAYAGGRRT
jgi:micrococcal nuclease